MAISQPTASDKLNSPDHSLSHRVFANDSEAPVKKVVVEADGSVCIGDYTGGNYIKISPANVLSVVGVAGLSIPHMMQSDSTDQAIANVTLAQVITFDTNVHANNITRTSASRFTITLKGSYLISFSGIASGNTGTNLEFWLRVNDADIPGSNTIYTFKSTGAVAVIACTFIEHFNVGDYFEFWTCGGNTNNKWEATAAGSTPTRPACPSIIMTCNYVGQD